MKLKILTHCVGVCVCVLVSSQVIIMVTGFGAQQDCGCWW